MLRFVSRLKNRSCKEHVDEHRCRVIFKIGDYMWAIFTRDHLLAREYGKLVPFKI